MINLIIADDHPIFIDGLKTVLADVPDINITGEAQNGKQVIELLEYKQADVVLLDIRMPEMDGIETAKEIKKRYPHVKIIILTQFGEKCLVKNFMELGVDGYLLKDCSQQDLINAIKTVLLHQAYMLLNHGLIIFLINTGIMLVFLLHQAGF